jgi:hypothetical protein
MKSILKVIFYSYIIFVFIIILLNLNANITFGNGLGDIFHLIALLILSIFYSVIYFKFLNKNCEKEYFFIYVFFLLSTILLLILMLTIWRGAEYTWNGRLFLQ